MPLAEARLLAIDELRSRGGRRRGCCRLGGVRRVEDDRRPKSDLDARNSATAAEVEIGFSDTFWTSGSAEPTAGGFSDGYRSNSESLWWCCSNNFKVLKASALPVPEAALANSPAARACSLIATVVSALCVATEAARAWS